MRRQLQYSLILLSTLFLAACGPDGPRYEFASVETTVSSRGVSVPATFVHPIAEGEEKFPLVVLAHGHGGTRNEAGGFTSVAEELATRGIASIRMDFPGCGDSVESFANNNLTNMLTDVRASRDYALSQPNIDRERVGIHGFSMGGRLALMATASDPTYKVMTTWAPGASNGAGSMVEFVGGTDAYEAMKAQARTNGFVPFTTSWGQDQQLGLRFFVDLEQSRPLDAASQFRGPLLVLYGDEDDVVLPSVSEAVINAATSSSEVVRHVIDGADHGLGLFTDEPDYTEEAVDTTVSFFASRL